MDRRSIKQKPQSAKASPIPHFLTTIQTISNPTNSPHSLLIVQNIHLNLLLIQERLLIRVQSRVILRLLRNSRQPHKVLPTRTLQVSNAVEMVLVRASKLLRVAVLVHERVHIAGNLLEQVEGRVVPMVLEFFESDAGRFDGEQVDAKNHEDGAGDGDRDRLWKR
jgi:hypothetical protein